MKAVILAAGMGTRLQPLTKDIPKCLLNIDGKTLLDRSLINLAEFGIRDVIIVTGFQSDKIEQTFGNSYHGIDLCYVTNPRYSETGSMYSFSQARDLIDDNILLLESDLLYEQKAIKVILSSPLDDVILVSNLLHSGDDVYICINNKQQITNLGKNIPELEKQQAIGCLVGISKFSPTFLTELFEQAERDYANNILTDHYEESVLKTSRSGHPVYVEQCSDLRWIEIDNQSDLTRAKQEILPSIMGR